MYKTVAPAVYSEKREDGNMNIFFEQAVRKPVYTILMGFLLGFSAAIT